MCFLCWSVDGCESNSALTWGGISKLSRWVCLVVLEYVEKIEVSSIETNKLYLLIIKVNNDS